MRFSHFEFDPAADRLGEGPQSEVYRAVDTRLGRTVALKILRPHVEFDPAAKERFEREAKHTSNLAHPNIATVYEYGQDRGTSYIVMEYLEGRTLDRILAERPLGYEEGLRVALQVASALALVHERGLIHRDLKPANVMVAADGSVKLLDFGICRSTNEASITQEGMLVGTVLYMAPEQVLGEELDVRTDVFAFGAVFYHALTGRYAFPGKSFPEVCMAILEASPAAPAEVRSGFPEPLSDFLLRCLERDPNERFADGGDAHGALLAVADEMRLEGPVKRRGALRGRVLVPPIAVAAGGDDLVGFAGGLRRDFSSELERSTDLQIQLLETDEVPPEPAGAFVVRSTLALAGSEPSLDATLDYVLERVGGNGGGGGAALLTERIHHTDADEWGLQGKLVGSLARSVRRRLAEVSLAAQAPRRDAARADALARRAHSVLHRGTSRHLITAIITFRTAIEADPGCALAHAGLAEALARKSLYWDGDATFLREARESAQVALDLDPRCAEAHTAIGFAHALTGNGAEAQREYRLAIQIDNEEWLAHRLLGALLGREGNYQGASPLLRRAIALRPTHIGSYDHLFVVLRRLDRYEEAIEIADRGIGSARDHLREVPDDQEARMHLALLLARMGLREDARAEVEAALERAPRDAYTWFHAGGVRALLGDEDAAMQALLEAQARGYHLPSELRTNADLDPLRGRPEFRSLLG